MFGKFAINASFTIIYLYGPEIYPTVIRSPQFTFDDIVANYCGLPLLLIYLVKVLTRVVQTSNNYKYTLGLLYSGVLAEKITLTISYDNWLPVIYLVTSANPKHTLLSDVILRRTILSDSLSCPPESPTMRPDSLLRLWRYTNPLLYTINNCRATLQSHTGFSFLGMKC